MIIGNRFKELKEEIDMEMRKVFVVFEIPNVSNDCETVTVAKKCP